MLITGKEGQVALSLVERADRSGHEVKALGRPTLDLARNRRDIIAAIVEHHPEVIVSAAAYTAVDKAESEEAAARAINVDGAEAVAHAARQLGVPLIHLSTDYVFDGTKPSAYVEQDATCPASVYGKTKLEGEEAVLSTHEDVAILRTAWVYSPFGSNFVKTMLRLGAERDEIAVVADQRGNPTSALDIADAILTVAENLRASEDRRLRGLFHMSGSGITNWAEFAETIFELSDAAGGPSARVRRIGTAEYPTPARRPANSSLDCTKIYQAHGVRLPEWQQSTSKTINRLLGATNQN